LDVLLSRSSEIPVFPILDSCDDIYSGSLKPTVEHVVTDISCYPGETIDVHDAGARTIVSGLSKAAFVANNVLVSCPKEWTPSSRLYNVLKLPSQPSGTQQCQLDIPHLYRDDAFAEANGEQLAWVSSLHAAGSLTELRVDYHGSAQLILNVKCDELWLLWPATERNLRWWGLHHGHRSDDDVTYRAVAELEDLHLLHATGPQAFILPPYHLHAVLAFDVSAHMGIPLWGYPWWETSREGIEWEILWAINYSLYGFSARDAENVLITIKKQGLDSWNQILRRFPDHRLAADVGGWLTTMIERVQNALDTIRDSATSNRKKMLSKRRNPGGIKKAKGVPRTTRRAFEKRNKSQRSPE
jgi:hypothetical protein